MLRQVRKLSALVALGVLAGCQREQPAPRPSASAPADAGGVPVSRATGSEYAVSASVAGPVGPGGSGELVARVEARQGFHINAEYPVSFRPDRSSEGIRFAQERFALQDSVERTPCPGGSPDACELRARVPFTATAAGEQRVAGVLAFSVCNPERCLIEKVPLEVPLPVR